MDQQRPPQGDNRYRVHASVKCYVGELACGTGGCTWYFSDSIERVVYRFPDGTQKILYKNRFYALQPADRMREIVSAMLQLGAGVHVGGKALYAGVGDSTFMPHPFIDISEQDDIEKYKRYYGKGY
jgi:hypothetical protein